MQYNEENISIRYLWGFFSAGLVFQQSLFANYLSSIVCPQFFCSKRKKGSKIMSLCFNRFRSLLRFIPSYAEQERQLVHGSQHVVRGIEHQSDTCP